MLSLIYIILFSAVIQRAQAWYQPVTANNTELLTWWHDTGEINTQSPVADGNVRQSGIYSVQVRTACGTKNFYYDSFVYEVIPANGMSNELVYATSYNQTQAWSSFLYSRDVTLKISRKSSPTNNVIIRPMTLNFSITYDDESAYISVPYSSHGYRFSVEFEDDLISLAPSGAMQPAHALLIFASPFEDASLVPKPDASTVIANPGRVLGLNTTTASTVIFYPGVYYFTGQDHMILSPNVTWVYFAPGAYVKGAVEFLSTASEVKATGHGVLSGEQYVWYADPDEGYQTASGANNNGLRMWRGTVGNSHQTFVLNGVTVSAPPFNSMDWSGSNLDLVTCMVNDYKQVGAFYGQTDGLEMYPGSIIQDVFYHVNDDGIKMYYSNVVAQNIIMWKVSVAPVVQFGWTPRNTENVIIDHVDVIHQAYQDASNNPGIFGSDNNYLFAPDGLSANHDTANSNMTVRNITWSNFRAEGPSACLFRIYALQNLDNIIIKNVWIEEFEPSSLNTTQSWMPVFYDYNNGKQVTVTNFVIEGVSVGNTTITANNAAIVGQIDVDPVYAASVLYE
ncbi:glycoside hydrolase [Lipomyces kononenkoae]